MLKLKAVSNYFYAEYTGNDDAALKKNYFLIGCGRIGGRK
jgi:hypothetical protein